MKQKEIAYVLLLILFMIAAMVRILPSIDVVYSEDSTHLLGVDPNYYLRHVETCVKNYPQLQKWDHATHYPDGVKGDAAGLYVFLSATLIKVVHGTDVSSDQVASFMAWIPIVILAFIYMLVFMIGKKVKDASAGLVGVYVLTLYPAAFLTKSLLGFADQHVLEVALSLWFLYGMVSLYKQAEAHIYSLKHILFYGLPIVLFFTIWPGAPLYILIAALIMFNFHVEIKAAKPTDKVVTKIYMTWFISVAAGIAVITYLLPDLLTSAFPMYENYLPIAIAFIPLAFLGHAYANVFLLKKYKPRTVKWILIVVQLIGLYLFLVYTEIGEAVLERFTLRESVVQENREVGFSDLLYLVGLPGVMAILGIVYGFKNYLGKKKIDWARWPVYFLFLFFTGYWMSSYDLDYMVSPFMAISAGIILVDIYERMKKRKTIVGIPYKVAAILFMVLIFVLPFFASSRHYRNFYKPMDLKVKEYTYPALRKSMQWLKTSTPPLPQPTDQIYEEDAYVMAPGQYGVLSIWDYGNLINQLGKRIPAWSRWNNIDKTKALYMPWKAGASTTDSLCVGCDQGQKIRYVLVDHKMVTAFFIGKLNELNLIPGCIRSKSVPIRGKATQVQYLSDCYTQSLAYQLFYGTIGNDPSFKLVYESEEKIAVGHFYAGNRPQLLSVPLNMIDDVSMNVINAYGSARVNNGAFFDVHILPQVKIYQVMD